MLLNNCHRISPRSLCSIIVRTWVLGDRDFWPMLRNHLYIWQFSTHFLEGIREAIFVVLQPISRNAKIPIGRGVAKAFLLGGVSQTICRLVRC